MIAATTPAPTVSIGGVVTHVAVTQAKKPHFLVCSKTLRCRYVVRLPKTALAIKDNGGLGA